MLKEEPPSSRREMRIWARCSETTQSSSQALRGTSKCWEYIHCRSSYLTSRFAINRGVEYIATQGHDFDVEADAVNPGLGSRGANHCLAIHQLHDLLYAFTLLSLPSGEILCSKVFFCLQSWLQALCRPYLGLDLRLPCPPLRICTVWGF